MTYSNNPAADAEQHDNDLAARGFFDAPEGEPPCCECCGSAIGEQWLPEVERLACVGCAFAYFRSAVEELEAVATITEQEAA